MRGSLVSRWWSLLRRRWRTGTVLFTVVGTLGVSVVLLSRAIYRAESKLRLGEPPPMGGISPTSGVIGFLRLGGDPFANDLELLASRSLAEGVVDDVALNVRVLAPRGWHRDSLFVSLDAGRGTTRARYAVAWERAAIHIMAPDGTELRATPGVPVTFGGVTAVFRAWREGMPRRITVRTVPHAEAVRVLGSRLGVERARRDANVVRLRYQGDDPRLVRDVVASVVARFVALRTAILQRESGETVDSLQSVAARMRVELASAEDAIEALQRSTGLIAPETQAETAIVRYSELTASLEQARVELRALSGALDRSAGVADAAASWSTLLSYPRFLENETVADLIARLTELEQRRRELARLRTEQNAEHRAVLDQIQYLDRSLRTVSVDYRETLQDEVSSLERQATELRQQLAAVPAQAIELGRKQRDLRVLNEMVVLTEQRLRQEELRQALTFANVQVIDPPALRDRPIWPRRKIGPAVALLIAGMTAVLGVVVVDRADTRVRSAAEVRELIGAPVLGVLVRERGAAGLGADDVAAIVRRAAIESPGQAHIAIADVADGRHARLVSDTLVAAAAAETEARLAAPVVEVLAPLTSFGAAAAAAARRTPIVIAIDITATTRDAVANAAALLREAQADIAGAVIICRRARERAEVWA